jgi:hypothetical protein
MQACVRRSSPTRNAYTARPTKRPGSPGRRRESGPGCATTRGSRGLAPKCSFLSVSRNTPGASGPSRLEGVTFRCWHGTKSRPDRPTRQAYLAGGVYTSRDSATKRRTHLDQTVHGALGDAQSHLNKMLGERDRGRSSTRRSKRSINTWTDGLNLARSPGYARRASKTASIPKQAAGSCADRTRTSVCLYKGCAVCRPKRIDCGHGWVTS